MIDDRFADCLAFTWLPNNDGQPLHVTIGDRGGATAWGVTLISYASWRSDHGIAGTARSDLASATTAELSDLIRSRYWMAVAGDLLPIGIDLLVYDFGFGSGPRTSARLLQEMLGVNQDGWIGPQSVAAAAHFNAPDLARALAARHDAYYRSLTDFTRFGNGWSRRNAARLAVALGAMGQKPAVSIHAGFGTAAAMTASAETADDLMAREMAGTLNVGETA